MLPYLLKLGPLKIGSYGVMLILAFLLTLWLLSKEIKRMGLPSDLPERLGIAGMLGGIVGAKIYFLLEHTADVARDPVGMIFSGGGLTWYGGFIGGLLAILWVLRKYSGRRLAVIELMAPLLILGYAIGRIGCLLAGDGDYGPPSNLPWAMTFPNGIVPTTIPVHPTPIYETLVSLLFFLPLWKFRHSFKNRGYLLSASLIAFGLERFLMEFWRLTPKVFWGWMSVAQLISILIILSGLAGLAFFNRQKEPALFH